MLWPPLLSYRRAEPRRWGTPWHTPTGPSTGRDRQRPLSCPDRHVFSPPRMVGRSISRPVIPWCRHLLPNLDEHGSSVATVGAPAPAQDAGSGDGCGRVVRRGCRRVARRGRPRPGRRRTDLGPAHRHGGGRGSRSPRHPSGDERSCPDRPSGGRSTLPLRHRSADRAPWHRVERHRVERHRVERFGIGRCGPLGQPAVVVAAGGRQGQGRGQSAHLGPDGGGTGRWCRARGGGAPPGAPRPAPVGDFCTSSGHIPTSALPARRRPAS